MKRTGRRWLAWSLLLLALSAPAWANVGTLLIFATVGHLLVGNAVIGAFEAWIAGRVVRGLGGLRTALPLVAANYASLLVGLQAVPLVRRALAPTVLGAHPVCHLPRLILAVLVIAFILTLAVEAPFFGLAAVLARNLPTRPTVRRVLSLLLIANLASYLLLALYYVPGTRVTLLTHCRRVATPDYSQTRDVVVYFRPNWASDELWRLRLDGTAPACVAGSWNAKRDELGEAYRWVGRDVNARAVDLRGEGAETWTDIWAGFWPYEGLSGRDAATGERLALALEMPYFMWKVRNATVLPGDQVVFQVDRYIVLLDLPTRRLADLATGDAPLVVLERRKPPG